MKLVAQSAFCKLIKKDELDCVYIKHPKFEAEICLQGAQITRFKPTDKPDLIWLSPTAEYKQGQSIRGGVPICWPWFGALSKNPEHIQSAITRTQAPHGFARTQVWSLADMHESCDRVSLKFQLQDNEETRAIWPHSFKLELQVHFSDDLAISLVTHNLSEQTLHISQALHSYFAVSDIRDCHISGVHDQTYIDALDHWTRKQQNGKLIINEETDRIYFGHSNYEIRTPEKRIRVHSDSNSSVIWNPWIDKSLRLSQFPNDGYLNMLCIESANVMDDSISILPNGQHSLTVHLSFD